MFLSDYIINEEVSEIFMDAIILILIPSPQEKPRLYSIQRAKQRETPKVGQDLEATRKHLNQNTVLPSSNVLAETCEEPTLDFHLPQGTFIHQGYLCDLCGSDDERNVFLDNVLFRNPRNATLKKACNNSKIQPAQWGTLPISVQGKHRDGRR